MTKKSLVLATLFLITFPSCSLNYSSINSGTKRMEDYQIVNDNQIQWSDVLKQNDDNYLVFIYSETCSNCHDIQQEVIDFAIDRIVETYFIDTKKSGDVTISKDIEPTIGASDMENVSILGTPTILEVENKTIKANVPGKDSILSLLNEKRFSKK